MKKTLNVAVLAVCFAMSCTTVAVKHPEIDAVKTVAIIGYTQVLDLSHSSDANTSTGFGGVTNLIKNAANADKAAARRRDENDQTFNLLWRSMGEATGWAVTPRDVVENNPEYQQLVAANASAYQTLPKMAASEAVRRFTPAQRTAIAKALGVDAVVWVNVRIAVGEISGVSIGGMGQTAKHMKGTTTLEAFDSVYPEAIWWDRNATGKSSATGIERTMGIDSDANEAAAVIEAAQGTADVMKARFREAMAAPVEKK